MAVLLRVLDGAVERATGLLFLIASLLMFAMVLTRYLFAFSDPSVEIIARYMMIWGTMLGVACAARRDINIRFALVETALGPRARRPFHAAGQVVAAAFAVGLGLSGASLVEETRMFNEVMPTTLRWPIWIFHLALPVGGFLLAFQILRRLVERWRDGDAAAPGETAAI